MNPRCFAGLLLVLAATAMASAEPLMKHSDVYLSGKDGYAMYRIPAIETAPDGSLLAFAEARKYGGGDPGMEGNDIDLVLKRSTDGGQTWSAMKIIEDPGEKWSAANPATIVDRQTNRVWVLYLRAKPGRDTDTARPGTDDFQTIARYSDDSGVTWSEPVDLTKAARDMNDRAWHSSVIGPGGAIQTSRGRLLAAVWKAINYNTLALFSDDHGRTWQRSQSVPGGNWGNECQVVELADGKILMDIRQNSGPHRWLSTSSDGGQTWSKPRPGEKVSAVACAIERYTLKSAGDDRDRIVWTGPKGPGRKTLVIRVSYDEGQTFTGERLISAEPAAYSDLTILKDKTSGVLWERADYRFITFTRLNREFLEPATPAVRK
jgi:sialidase-1